MRPLFVFIILITILVLSGCTRPTEQQQDEEGSEGVYVSTLGDSCTAHTDCKTPMDYLVQSNCPFASACIDNVCKVICPFTMHDPDPEVSRSYPLACTADADCSCEERGERTIDCVCLDGACVSVEAE